MAKWQSEGDICVAFRIPFNSELPQNKRSGKKPQKGTDLLEKDLKFAAKR